MSLPGNLSTRQQQIVLVISTLVGLLLFFRADLPLLTLGTSPPQIKRFQFPESLRLENVQANGWRLQEDGLALAPGQRALLQLSLSRRKGDKFLFDVDLPSREKIGAKMEVRVRGQAVPVPVEKLGIDPIDLTFYLQNAEQFDLKIELADQRTSGSPRVLLGYLDTISQQGLFPASLLAYTLANFFLTYLLLKTFNPSKSEAAFAYPFTVVGWLIMQAAVSESLRLFTPQVFYLLVAAVLIRLKQLGRLGDSKALIEKLCGVAILLIALDARWVQVEKLQARVLDPDPTTYLHLAQNASYFIDTEIREPLFIFMVKLGGWLFGATHFGMRLTTLAASMAVLALIWRAGRDVFSPVVGLFGTLAMALHRNFIYVNIRGYRLEIYAGLLLLFFWFWFGKKDWSYRKRTLSLSITASLLALTRANSLSTMIVMLVIAWLVNRWPVRLLIPVVICPFIALIPSMIYWNHNYGDPMVAVNIHLKYYRNIEFSEHPDVPKDGNSYRGPDTNSIGYFLTEWHTPSQTISNIGTGLYEIYFGRYGWKYLFHGSYFMMALCLLGLARWLFAGRWLVLVWLFLLSAPVAFFQPISLDFRLILHILPLLGFAIGDFLQSLVDFWRTKSEDNDDTVASENASNDIRKTTNGL